MRNVLPELEDRWELLVVLTGGLGLVSGEYTEALGPSSIPTEGARVGLEGLKASGGGAGRGPSRCRLERWGRLEGWEWMEDASDWLEGEGGRLGGVEWKEWREEELGWEGMSNEDLGWGRGLLDVR